MSKKKRVYCLDRGTFKKTAEITPEGFLITDAIVTRTGVFDYMNLDGVEGQLRHPDDVFELDSLNSLKMIPITLNHPESILVTAEDAKNLSVGFTGENVRPDGENLIVTLKVTDKDAIKAIQDGKNELSLGYTLDHEDESGTYKGKKYTIRQRNIVYNHLAIVDRARAGKDAKIHLDGSNIDAIQVDELIFNIDNNKPHKKPKGVKMFKVNIDGVDYEIESESVAKHIAKLAKDNDNCVSEIDSLKKSIDEKQAEIDSAKEKIEELKNVDNSKLIADGVAARIDLERSARKILGDSVKTNVDGEEQEKEVSSMDEMEIKKAVISSVFPKRSLDGKSDDYINASFEIANDTFIEKDSSDDDDDGDNFNADNHFEEMNNDGVRTKTTNVDSARAKMIARRNGEK